MGLERRFAAVSIEANVRSLVPFTASVVFVREGINWRLGFLLGNQLQENFAATKAITRRSSDGLGGAANTSTSLFSGPC